MAKKHSTQDSPPEVGERNGKREKKLAKQEAKAMLVVDDARDKLAKAEKKLANAQMRLEERRIDLQAAEVHLTELRNSHQPAGAANDGATPEETTSSEGSTDATDTASDTGNSEEPALVTHETAGADEPYSHENGAPASSSEIPEETATAGEPASDSAPAGEAGEASSVAEDATQAGESPDSGEQTQENRWWQHKPKNSNGQGEHES